MRAPLDWIARVIMLALAGMVSLSIIGTIAAIPSGTIEGRIGMEESRSVVEEVAPDEQLTQPGGEPAAARPEAGLGKQVAGKAAPPPAPTSDEKIVQWLEAITYALIALVGLAALATLVLWRGVQERRRIADALEVRGLPPSS